MALTHPRIFLSYRREDSSEPAGRLCECLGAAFGKDALFLDVDNIQPGADFAVSLVRALRRCDVLLVIVGPQWVSLRGRGGRRRLEDRFDYVRMELLEGFSRALPTIPVLVEGAAMPREEDLPDKLRWFHRRQAVTIRTESFERDAHALTGQLDQLLREAAQARARSDEDLSIRDYFDLIVPMQLRARGAQASKLASEITGRILFHVVGEEGGSWTLVLDESGPRMENGACEDAHLSITITDGAMRNMLRGSFDARKALASGDIRLSGDVNLLPHVAMLVFGG